MPRPKIIVLAKKSQKIENPRTLQTCASAWPARQPQDTAITAARRRKRRYPPLRRRRAAIQALITGQVDAIGANTTVHARSTRSCQTNDFEQKLTFNEQWMGVATRPGQKQLNEWLNNFIEEIKANGQLDAISKKWIGQPLPQFPASVAGVPFTVQ